MSQTQQPSESGSRSSAGTRGHVAGIVALVALFVIVAAWFWNSFQPSPPAGVEAGLGAPHGVMVIGAGAFIAALIAQIRTMSAWEILEVTWELLLGLFGLIGAVLKGILNWFLGLIGWN
jgi:hypothetical protein